MTLLRRTFVPFIAVGALTLGACDDPTEIEEHFDVEGIAIVQGATEIYRYMLDDDAVPTLTLTEGVHDVAIVPLDHDGNAIPEEDHEAGEEEHELLITSANTSVLTWTPEAGADDAHTFVEFHGELNALQAGSTTLNLCVPHEGHCDFEVDVPVSVTAQ